MDLLIKQWDIASGNLIRTYTGASVLSIFVSGNNLFSGSGDNTTKQWDIATGNLIKNYTGHTSAVISVFISGNNLFSGSGDKTIKQWDITTGNLVRTYTGHTSSVNSVFVSGNNLFSGSGGSMDGIIKQWDIVTGNLIKTYTGHTNYITSVFVSDNNLFSGSWDATIKQWDITTGNMIKTYTGHISGVAVFSVFVSGNYLFSGSHDNTIKQWDIIKPASSNTPNILPQSSTNTPNISPQSPSNTPNISAIAGGAVGSFIFLAIIIIGVLFWRTARQRKRKHQESEDKTEAVETVITHHDEHLSEHYDEKTEVDFEPRNRNAYGDSQETEASQLPTNTNTNIAVDPTTWTKDNVVGWLEQEKLDTLSEDFRRHSIDGAAMMCLTEEDMRAMAIPVGRIKRFILARSELLDPIFTTIPKK